MKPICFVTLLLLAMMACKKNNTPPKPPTDDEITYPRLIKITIASRYYRDTIMWDIYGRVAYNNVWVDNVSQTNSVYNAAFRYYNETGVLKEVVTNVLGWIEFNAFPTYISRDSMIVKYRNFYTLNDAYRLDTGGFPIRGYQFSDSIGTRQRLHNEWVIDAKTQDVIRESDFGYASTTPAQGGFDTVPYFRRDSIFTYTNILNPLYPINRYNPFYSFYSFVPDEIGLAAMSKHMPMARYSGKGQMNRSYRYELDESGKWPVKQVRREEPFGDSVVAIFTYKK